MFFAYKREHVMKKLLFFCTGWRRAAIDDYIRLLLFYNFIDRVKTIDRMVKEVFISPIFFANDNAYAVFADFYIILSLESNSAD